MDVVPGAERRIPAISRYRNVTWGWTLSGANTHPAVFKTRPRSSCVECAKWPGVPRILHFIWVGGALPKKYAANIKRHVEMNPTWDICLWVDSPGAVAVADFPSSVRVRVVAAHMHLFRNADLIARERNLAGKSDYIRLEVVYLDGGVYMDTDSIPIRGLDSTGTLFRRPFVSHDPDAYMIIQNAVFAAEKGSAFLDFALNLTRENCITWRQCGAMEGAGPPFFTRALLEYGDEQITFVHQTYLVAMYTDPHPNGISYHTNDHTWWDRGTTGLRRTRCGTPRRAKYEVPT